MIRVSIRRAEPEDAEELAALHVRSLRWAYSDLLPAQYLAAISVERLHATWVAMIQEPNPSHEIFLAQDEGGRPVGFVIYGRCRDADASEQTGEVMGIYIDENRAGWGVGRGLMDHALAGLRAGGFTEVTLWVLRDNARARRFYEKMGFLPDGTTRSEERPVATLHELRYRRPL